MHQDKATDCQSWSCLASLTCHTTRYMLVQPREAEACPFRSQSHARITCCMSPIYPISQVPTAARRPGPLLGWHPQRAARNKSRLSRRPSPLDAGSGCASTRQSRARRERRGLEGLGSRLRTLQTFVLGTRRMSGFAAGCWAMGAREGSTHSDREGFEEKNNYQCNIMVPCSLYSFEIL